MRHIKGILRYILWEPFIWLFYYFFQPMRFKREIVANNALKRVIKALRLTLLVFLVSYPLTLAARMNLCSSLPGLVTCNFSGILWITLKATAIGVVAGVVTSVGSIGIGIAEGIVISIALVIGVNTHPGISLANLVIILAAIWGFMQGIAGNIIQSIAAAIAWSLVSIIIGGPTSGIVGSVTFILSYILGYSRLLLYPISSFSSFRVYLAGRRNPFRILFYLHSSALFWDEHVFLPLPYLRSTLLIIAEQDVEKALEEIIFIATERPTQIRAARTVLLEIAIRDLEIRQSLAEIAEFSHRLDEIFPQETGVIDPGWVTLFARLRNASQEAALFCSPISLQSRRHALEAVKGNLQKIYLGVAFRDSKLHTRLNNVIEAWLESVQRELEKLQVAPQEIGRIDNPYRPGQVLKLSDTLFVGRHDLAQQLEEALGRGDRRPTFLLKGERRMGKSSTLRQLPILLGSRYIPIYYDLQRRGISSNTATFLGTITAEIYTALNARGIHVTKLEHEKLREASKENDAVVYATFDNWLDDVEVILQQEDSLLLLTFDEFEKLQEAGQQRYLDLHLLLDWFRYVIQHRTRLALLFSGVQALRDIGIGTDINWASYFVNVETLKVSFLRVHEAHQLITRPVPNFPGEQIFSNEVVDKITYETGGHPFLIQAVCSALIDNLNIDLQDHAEVHDVKEAVDQVLENWWDTYFHDLWYRTDEDQRTCLAAVSKLGMADLHRIQHQSGLDIRIVQQTVQTLLKRDLVLCNEEGIYHIAAPIFNEWVERNLFN